jgi:phage terminase large subunit-like protein
MTRKEAWALLDELARMTPEERRLLLSRLPPAAFRTLAEEWFWRAHGGQREPVASAGSGPGDWLTWLLRAGRGFGKTRAGAEWVWARVREAPNAQIALVGGNLGEVVRVMINGPSGLIATAGTGERALWVPTARTLRFASGAQAFAYSGERPDALRGPEHDFAWCDELAKWRHGDATWDNLMLGLRRGARPRTLVTTTPKAVPLLRRIRGLDRFVETLGTTRGNPHSVEAFVQAMDKAYGGTRLGRQELEGELIEDVEGALWPRALIEANRTEKRDCPAFLRVVVGVDPPASAAGTCGISVCALGEDGICYVLADASESGLSPEGWARSAARAAETWGADRVVAEANKWRRDGAERAQGRGAGAAGHPRPRQPRQGAAGRAAGDAAGGASDRDVVGEEGGAEKSSP